MTKAEEKREPQTTRVAPSKEQMEMAYQAHTLAQMLYGQLTMNYPWAGPMSNQPGFGSMGQPMGHPMGSPMGQTMQPWTQGCTGYCPQPRPHHQVPFATGPYPFAYGYFPRW